MGKKIANKCKEATHALERAEVGAVARWWSDELLIPRRLGRNADALVAQYAAGFRCGWLKVERNVPLPADAVRCPNAYEREYLDGIVDGLHAAWEFFGKQRERGENGNEPN